METLKTRIGKKSAFGREARLPQPRPDLHWDASDKIDRYRCIEQIFKLNSDLEQAKHEAEFNEKKRLLADLEYKVKEQELKLNELRALEYHQIKGMLKERKESIDPRISADQILEHYKCKLFDKQKFLDILRHEENQLGKEYEYHLEQLAKLKERDKYKESSKISDDLKVKQLEFELSNHEIQIQSYVNFLNDCGSVIKRLSEESLNYPNEVHEQSGILNAMNKLGMPAYNDALKNKKRLENMEKRMQHGASTRQTSIASYKRKLLTNEQNIFKHLPKDDNFQTITPDRYIQETPNVTALRTFHEKMKNDTKQLCDAAASSNIHDLHLSVNDIFSKLKAGGEKVDSLENRLTEIDDQIHRAKQQKNVLSYSITEKDLGVRLEIDDSNKTVDVDSKTQELLESKFGYGTEQLLKIQFALQHIVDLLRNVSSGRPMIRKKYSNEILSLPLFELHLGNYEDETEPPEIIEEDLGKLFASASESIDSLMVRYKNVDSTGVFWQDCQNRHEKLILEELDHPLEN